MRRVAKEYFPTLDLLAQSGLYDELVSKGLLIPHREITPDNAGGDRILQPELIQSISYPYEWCFSQLKDAALATLEVQRLALEKGMSLKDASAYNVQFHKGSPLVIDTLSFEVYDESSPWKAYRQFCEHFLAPLSLMSFVDARLNKLLRTFIDGVPLEIASRMLPFRTRFSPGLSMHVHLHARAQKSSGGASGGAKAMFSKAAMLGLIDSLRGTTEKLEWKTPPTVWGDYYQNTNYSAEAMTQKKLLIAELLGAISPKPSLVWDLGANTGEFSGLAAAQGMPTVAWDFDPAAVEQAYTANRKNPLVLPLMIDLTNPSPRLGWAHGERESFVDRCKADTVMALALIHHLAIGNNVPLPMIASFFASLSPWLLIEFVPKEDSQVQRLMASRSDSFLGYTQDNFEQCFGELFATAEKRPIEGTSRTLYVLKRR
ncbi:MAG: SAM-dependent methyltransferase [Fimbriimonas sp.]